MKKILLLFIILLGIGSGWRFMRSPDTVVPDACSCDGEHDGDFIVEHFAEICDKYCFSMWLPHGAMWTQNCFSTKSECEMELADVPNRTYANTCHQPEILTAWCVDDILTGDTRFYDSPPDTEYELMTTVCTRTESECHAIQRYQARHSTATCRKQMVFLHPGEASYLTPESELIEIIKKMNTKNKRIKQCTKSNVQIVAKYLLWTKQVMLLFKNRFAMMNLTATYRNACINMR